MLRKLAPRSIYDVMAFVGCFAALATGTAYAAGTVFSSDIVDNEVYSADVRDDNLSGGGLGASDLANGSVTTGEVRDDTQFPYGLYSQDLAADSVKSSEIADGAVGSSEVQNESLTGADIANGSLRLGDVGFDAITGLQVLDYTLHDVDVGAATLRQVAVDIGVLTATSCVNRFVNIPGTAGNHVLLTPSADDAHGALMYDARYNSAGTHGNDVTIHVCNFSTATINDATTHFNVLTFNAQA